MIKRNLASWPKYVSQRLEEAILCGTRVVVPKWKVDRAKNSRNIRQRLKIPIHNAEDYSSYVSNL
jgi:hypothetical protein